MLIQGNYIDLVHGIIDVRNIVITSIFSDEENVLSAT